VLFRECIVPLVILGEFTNYRCCFLNRRQLSIPGACQEGQIKCVRCAAAFIRSSPFSLLEKGLWWLIGGYLQIRDVPNPSTRAVAWTGLLWRVVATSVIADAYRRANLTPLARLIQNDFTGEAKADEARKTSLFWFLVHLNPDLQNDFTLPYLDLYKIDKTEPDISYTKRPLVSFSLSACHSFGVSFDFPSALVHLTIFPPSAKLFWRKYNLLSCDCEILA